MKRTSPVEWLAMALVGVVAGALVVVPTLAHRAVSGTYAALVEAQGNTLVHAADDEWRDRGRPPDAEALQALLKAHAADGLRYAAVMMPGGTVEAGTSVGPPPEPRPGFDLVHGRGRIVGHLAPPNGRRPPPEGFGPPPPFDTPPGFPPPPGGPPRVAPPLLVLEFEPLGARSLEAEADRARLVGIAAAALFVLLGGALFRTQRQRERLRDELGHRRHLASLGEMAAVMAHEIRNPLASLKGHAQLLREMLPAGREQAKAERLVNEAVRMEALTTDLLDFARQNALRRAAVDPAALLRASVESVGGGVAVEAGGAPPRWSLDEERMRQVLQNVLENAKQAGGDPPEARVAREGADLVFEVSDRGPGIPEDALERIFEPFHTGRVRGTGLGLAIARRIVELHGGRIAARNRPDGGASFIIRVPPEEA
jgi:two-component system sensor histidine kinase HydH